MTLSHGKVRDALSVTGLMQYVKKYRKLRPNLFTPATVEYRMAQVRAGWEAKKQLAEA